MKLPMLSRAAARAGKASEWIVLVCLLLATIPPVLLRHNSLTVIGELNLVDGSWIADTVYKAAHGIWLGRDVVFTYGPVYQWLASAPARWVGVSLGSIFATSQTLPWLLVVLAGFLIARLLLPETAAWRRALFLLLFVVCWAPPDLRTSYCLLAFAVFLRLVDSTAVRGRAISPRAMCAALICIVGFLISADTGLYTVAALLLRCAASAIVRRRSAEMVAKFLFLTAVSAAVGVILVNAWMGAALDFGFWRASLAIASGYRWFEPIAMSKADKRLVLVTLAFGIVVFGVAWHWRRSSGPWTRRPAFLLGGFFLAFLMMQSALVRPDRGHVLIGIAPMLILCGAIVLEELDARLWLQIGVPSVVLLATILLAGVQFQFQPRNLLSRLHQFTRPVLACPAGLQAFDRACLTQNQAQLFSTVSAYVGARETSGAPIVVFPYETVFGLISGREVAGGVLQSYIVNGYYLNRLAIAGLQRTRPPFGLYFPDGALSVAVDSIPNFTRSPELWFYLLEHYRGDLSPFPGVIGLTADDTRAARLTMSEQQIASPLGRVRITKRSTSLDLGPVRWPDAGADFIKLRLRAHYPPWWHLRKPSKLALVISFDDGSEKSTEFLVPPNRATDVWFYPWDPHQLPNYFSSDSTWWRVPGRPSPARLTLRVNPFDWISVIPRSVEIQNVEAVRLDMR